MAKLLIVEDDNHINNLLYDLLVADYQVDQAYSGTEGKRLLDQGQYDLVVLDLMLPGMSGEDFIQAVRQSSQIPIVVITARTEIEVLDQVFKLGANDYIAKPFHTVEVKARVASQLKHAQGVSSSPVLSVDEVSLDTEKHEVRVHGHLVNLKAKEYDLLKYFIQYPDKVYTKANLYESVWQEAYYGDDNTISVHISRLRHELGKYTDRELIKTIWGVGFKFNRKA